MAKILPEILRPSDRPNPVPDVTPGVASSDSAMDANIRSLLVGIRRTAEDPEKSEESEDGYITSKVSYTEILAPP